ncbi:flavin reductase [Arthrobacter sp. I2-34]|uniref:Flavin reductase n=1 Tax=Arthrobacter hankyongi TaxID=2904801 RepID=A0ABS9LAI0_9MICC|nr:flavin reductase [Arthrobacter hankyongi]MCG2623694.1 flavin reductase [Arthrobacter hankyongi]
MNQLTQIQKDFRTAMAHLPAAVSIITTDGPHGRIGITVSAVCSVTDAPPTLLVCVNRRSAAHDIFRSNGKVCINVLSGDGEELARHFSGMTGVSMEERFAWNIWDDEQEVPVLSDAHVKVIGTIEGMAGQGSHSVLFIKVDRVAVNESSHGLVYFNRNFVRVDPLGDRVAV